MKRIGQSGRFFVFLAICLAGLLLFSNTHGDVGLHQPLQMPALSPVAAPEPIALRPLSHSLEFAVSSAVDKAEARVSSRANKADERLRALRHEKQCCVDAAAPPMHMSLYDAGRSSPSGTQEMQVYRCPDTGVPRQIRVQTGHRNETRSAPLARPVPETHDPSGAVDGPDRKEKDLKDARTFLSSNRGMLRLANPDRELRLSRYEIDTGGRRQLRFSQFYRDVPVWPAELKVHMDRFGEVDLVSGAFVPTPRRMVLHPAWCAQSALEQARKAFSGGQGALACDPEKIIYAPGDHPPRLAWKFEFAISFDRLQVVVIDASNGKTLTSFNRVPKQAVTGQGVDLRGDWRSLSLWAHLGQYYMVDTSKPMFPASPGSFTLIPPMGAILVNDMRNQALPSGGASFPGPAFSGSRDSGWVPDAVSLAHNLSETYDYFIERHKFDSMDGEGGNVIGFVRVDSGYNNAFYNPTFNALFFGDGQPFAGALDIVAHEYVHGVTAHTSNLIYQDQPGALNEALSDIFGEMVEARTTGRTDWEMGTNLPAAIRSLRDPASWQIGNSGYYYPSRMSEYYGRNHSLLQSLPDQDYGGVHINMTIITRCFYLLAESLPGAIGIQEAADIFFRANQVHLVQNSQFIDMRLAAIVSAEELFGPGSHQARKVAEAFDAVEIFESQVLPPDPSPEPPVSGEESAVFISEDSGGGYFLARYEKALGDEEPGTWLSCFDVAPARPSVSGDGSEVFFVDSINDACFIDTNPGYECEWCLEMPGEIYSVAMSFDRKLYGFVFLDADGEPIDEIGVIDLRSDDEPRVFSLRAPSTEGVLLNTVLFADSMFFTADNRYLIYDAFNVIEFEDRTRLGVWSIYAIDLSTGQTIPLVGPFTDAHVGFPSPGKVSNNLITFDLLPDNSNDTIVVAMDMVSGENKIVATVNDAWSIPGYSGDDRAILYSRPDPLVPTGYSYARQPLAANGIDPVGSHAWFVRDGFFGVSYRRGDYVTPVGEIAVLPDSLNFGSVRVDESNSKSVTIQNQGNGNLMVHHVFLTGAGQDAYRLSGGCTGQRLKASASCTVFVSFSPDETGEKSAHLRVESDDQTHSMVQITVSGEGVDLRDGGGGSSGCFMDSVSGKDG